LLKFLGGGLGFGFLQFDVFVVAGCCVLLQGVACVVLLLAADLVFYLLVVVKGCYRLLFTAQLQIAVFGVQSFFWVAGWLSLI
jgi:hypothetical protein